MKLPKTRAEFARTTLGRSFYVLPKNDRRKLCAVLLFQVFLGVLDLVGIAIFGVLGALAVTGVGSRTPGSRVSVVLDNLGLSGLSLQWQAIILAILVMC